MKIEHGNGWAKIHYGRETTEQDRAALEAALRSPEIEAREECARRGLDPDDYAADGVFVWMVVHQEMQRAGK